MRLGLTLWTLFFCMFVGIWAPVYILVGSIFSTALIYLAYRLKDRYEWKKEQREREKRERT